jgi:hypothetical protein
MSVFFGIPGIVAGGILAFNVGISFYSLFPGLFGASLVGLGIFSKLSSIIANKTAKVLNSSRTIRQNRAINSQNFNQFVEKFVNRDGFKIGENDKLNKELHAIYLDYKYGIINTAKGDVIRKASKATN